MFALCSCRFVCHETCVYFWGDFPYELMLMCEHAMKSILPLGDTNEGLVLQISSYFTCIMREMVRLYLESHLLQFVLVGRGLEFATAFCAQGEATHV